MSLPPLICHLQGVRRRVLYVSLYELLAIFMVTVTLALLTNEGWQSSGGLAVGCSAIAVAWNLVFNSLFECWEKRQAERGRSVLRRIVHAIGFEGGLALWLVPFIAWWLKIGIWQALLMDIGFLLFFLIYTFAFTWGFDRLFGLPESAQ